MRVGFFVTCLVDLMRPSIGFAAIRLLEAGGAEVYVPPRQTCCGQPGYNSGDRAGAKALAAKLVTEFEGCEYLVAPSGSCSGTIRTHYADLFRDDRNPVEILKWKEIYDGLEEACDACKDYTHVLANVVMKNA